MGLRLISEGRDFLGLLLAAHLAALSFTCVAWHTLYDNKNYRKMERETKGI